MSKFDYGVFIGRFQPLHIGHEAVIRSALEKVDTLIVLIGSARQARTPAIRSRIPSAKTCSQRSSSTN